MTDGLGLHVEFEGPSDGDGAGRPILVLHGFTGSTITMWPLARSLSDTRSVAVVDLPGHGRSTAVRSSDDAQTYGFEHTVDAVAQVIDQHDLGPTHLVGYSMGGRVALGLAIRHPEQVTSLSL
ncbi:MAG: alpha/beta fold hydrolase, partial [Acidimicrobiaceae bacterium]|nr:alpha/beta fold hydrolase [Acidimicrobiaceae bacterium]